MVAGDSNPWQHDGMRRQNPLSFGGTPNEGFYWHKLILSKKTYKASRFTNVNTMYLHKGGF